MRFSDTLSIAGLVVVLALLLHGARHGPMEPLFRTMHLTPTTAEVSPPPQPDHDDTDPPSHRMSTTVASRTPR